MDAMHGKPTERIVPLTRKQLQIAIFVYLGMESADIAANLHRSTQTIKNTLRAIYLKLGLSNRTELAVLIAQSKVTGCEKPDLPPKQLTEHQLTIARYVSWGWSNKKISIALAVTEGTIRNEMVAIFDRVGVHNRGGLATFVIESGLAGNIEHPQPPVLAV